MFIAAIQASPLLFGLRLRALLIGLVPLGDMFGRGWVLVSASRTNSGERASPL